MTFFKRTKVLFYVIFPLFLITLVFSGIELIGPDFSDIFSSPSQHFGTWALWGVCFVLGVASLCLYCLRRDAEEDIKAAFDYAKQQGEKAE